MNPGGPCADDAMPGYPFTVDGPGLGEPMEYHDVRPIGRGYAPIVCPNAAEAAIAAAGAILKREAVSLWDQIDAAECELDAARRKLESLKRTEARVAGFARDIEGAESAADARETSIAALEWLGLVDIDVSGVEA